MSKQFVVEVAEQIHQACKEHNITKCIEAERKVRSIRNQDPEKEKTLQTLLLFLSHVIGLEHNNKTMNQEWLGKFVDLVQSEWKQASQEAHQELLKTRDPFAANIVISKKTGGNSP